MPDDQIPPSLLPVLGVFFEEMWPVLSTAAETLTRYIKSDAHTSNGELPGKTFSATPGFVKLQTEDGPLTHDFEIGGIKGRRMVIPYQIWMLQRVEQALDRAVATATGRESIETFLAQFPRGSEILKLADLLKDCRVRKQGALLYSVT